MDVKVMIRKAERQEVPIDDCTVYRLNAAALERLSTT